MFFLNIKRHKLTTLWSYRISILICCTYYIDAFLWAQETDKEQFTLEEATNNKQDTIKGDEVIVIEENKYYIKNKKKKYTIISPKKIEAIKWDNNKPPIFNKKQDKNKLYTIDLIFLYGLYNQLGALFSFYKREQWGTYKLEYKRSQLENKGRLSQKRTNSSKSLDHFSFNIHYDKKLKPKNQFYYFDLNLNFKNHSNELQQNFFYRRKNQKLLAINWFQKFQLKKQILHLTLKSNYILTSLSNVENISSINATTWNIHPEILWEYTWKLKKQRILSFGIQTSLYFGSNDTLITKKDIHLLGDILTWFKFLLVSKKISNKELPYRLFLKTGVNGYFSNTPNFIFGPNITLEQILDTWTLQIIIERKTNVANYNNLVYELPYSTPLFIRDPEDVWAFRIHNSLDLNDKIQLTFNLGYEIFTSYHSIFSDSNSQLYTIQNQKFQNLYLRLAFEQTFKYVAYQVGSEFEYHLSQVFYEPPISIFLSFTFKIKGFKWKINTTYIHIRKTEQNSLPLYILLDTYLSYDVLKQLTLFIEGKNLINYKYQQRLLYEESGLQVWGGVKISF